MPVPAYKFANNALSTLSTAVTSNTQASLALQTGHGARFPNPLANDFFMVTIDDGSNVEVCKCIARSTDTLTVLRGQEGTTAQSSFAIGSKVELRLTTEGAQWIGDNDALDLAIIPVINTNSMQAYGVPVPTLVGSWLGQTLTNSSVRESQPRIRVTVADSAQFPAEVRLAQALVSGQRGFRYRTRFGFAATPVSAHFFVGLTNTTGQVNSVSPPTSMSSSIVIGFDANSSSQNLRIYHADSGAVASTYDLGSYFNVSTTAWYEFGVDVAPGDTNWWVRVRRLDISSVSDVNTFFSSNLPNNSLWLSPMLHQASMVTSRMMSEWGGFWVKN